MFLDLDGILYDYFNGEDDLKNRRIRFVGDAAKRIREDYLRIFRYFRFHTRFGSPGNHDPEALSIMRDNVEGLERISGERIWSELKRIFSNLECADSVAIMFNQLHIGRYAGFGTDSIDLDEFHRVQQRLRQVSPNSDGLSWKPQTLLSSLIDSHERLLSIVSRLKLSNNERDAIAYILAHRGHESISDEHWLKSQLALAPKPIQNSLRDFVLQYLLYMGGDRAMVDEIVRWPIPDFPFSGSMVANRVRRKSEISELLSQLKSAWARSRFSMTESEMRAEVDRILGNKESQ